MLVGKRTRAEVHLRRLEAGEDPAGELLAINFSERRHFTRLLRQFMGVREADRILDEWRQRERRVLDRIVGENAVYELGIPRRATSDPRVVRALSSKVLDVLRGELAEERSG